MKIAYLLNWELNSQDGVSKKVYAQTHAWLAAGHDVQIFSILTETITEFGDVPFCQVKKVEAANILQEYRTVFKAYQAMFSYLQEFKPDVIYFRFDIYQPALTPILQNFPTVVEINTNDVEELKLIARKNIKGKIRFFYHLLVRNHYFKQMKGFCCVTHEIAALPNIQKFKKPVFVIPNALDSREFTCPVLPGASSGLIPRLVFMGSPKQAWHGLDKLMELARHTLGKLHFDIIGTYGEEFLDKLSNVTFHGYLKKHQYEKVVCSGDIGICTLALHRNNMQEASPLKTREYLAYGLPIILAYKDTAFLDQELPDWALQLPNRETNIRDHLQDIIRFCYQNKNRRLSKAETDKFIDSSSFESQRLENLVQIAFKG